MAFSKVHQTVSEIPSYDLPMVSTLLIRILLVISLKTGFHILFSICSLYVILMLQIWLILILFYTIITNNIVEGIISIKPNANCYSFSLIR
jgi:hypothetical protein